MSNYPPGVTGMEPEIAGYPEVDMEVECADTDAPLLGAFEVVRLIQDELIVQMGREARGDTPNWSEWVWKVLDEIEDLVEMTGECGWNGVTTTQIADGEAQWSCPRCGKVQSVELEDDRP